MKFYFINQKGKKEKERKSWNFCFYFYFFMEDKLGFPNKNNKIIWEYPKKDEPDIVLKKRKKEISIF